MFFRGKTIIFLMRENKSTKRIKLSTGKTEFTYKKGKYYLQDRGCFLRNKRVYAFYFEGIPNPISFDNIIGDIPNKVDADTEANLKIDSSVIKDMTEKDFLNALTQTSIEPMAMIYLILSVLSIGISCIALYFIYQVFQLVGA